MFLCIFRSKHDSLLPDKLNFEFLEQSQKRTVDKMEITEHDSLFERKNEQTTSISSNKGVVHQVKINVVHPSDCIIIQL